MKYTDIAIIGGGLAGSTAAAVLGRAGILTVLIDPHQVSLRLSRRKNQRRRAARSFLPDRNRRFGAALGHPDGENWITRFGYSLDEKPSRQYGIMYDAL